MIIHDYKLGFSWQQTFQQCLSNVRVRNEAVFEFPALVSRWFSCEQPGGAERRSINLIIREESQIGGISRQELSAKAADLKMSVNLTRLAAHYFYKLTFCFQSAKVIPRVSPAR